MRFDDTNPEKEETEYVNAILDAVKWLGFDWESNFNGQAQDHLYYASNYFDFMYRAAEYLIDGRPRLCGRANTGRNARQPGRLCHAWQGQPLPQPHAGREPGALPRHARRPSWPTGRPVLRAKIDMASPNINLRDPAIYRIRRATHHNTGDTWCIYPMYTFAHPIEDALEQITHSICTLEFEDQRPFYDWLLARLAEAAACCRHRHPQQYEFARLNLTYVITSKRKLKQLVDEGTVEGWDDPRMPTIVGLRRRGYTPEAIQLFCERIGVSKSDSWIDYSTLDIALRDDLENKAHRGMAVLDPVKLVLSNWDEVMGAGHLEPCSLPALPHPHARGHARARTSPVQAGQGSVDRA
jgi:glutaminyl-tRNA synthetase